MKSNVLLTAVGLVLHSAFFIKINFSLLMTAMAPLLLSVAKQKKKLKLASLFKRENRLEIAVIK